MKVRTLFVSVFGAQSDNPNRETGWDHINEVCRKTRKVVKPLADQVNDLREGKRFSTRQLEMDKLIANMEAAKAYALKGASPYETKAAVGIAEAMLDLVRQVDQIYAESYRQIQEAAA